MLGFKNVKKVGKDNRGMSLVETIVAIAILSVAVGPLLYTFVFSTKYNAKAKVKQRATNAAVSVMETFKAYDLKTSYDLFTAGSFIKGNSASYSVTYVPYVDGAGVTVSDDVASADYSITGMRFSDSDGSHTYNVNVEVRPGAVSTIESTPLYNKYRDVLFAEDRSNADYEFYDPYKIVNYFFGAGNPFGIRGDEVQNVEIGRQIYVDISATGEVSVEYRFVGNYTINGTTKSFAMSSTAATLNGAAQPAYAIDKLKNTLTPEPQEGGAILPLRDVYLYFYPVYKDRSNAEGLTFAVKTRKDAIYVTNGYSEVVDIYAFKQKDSANYTEAGLKIKENSYKVDVHRTGLWASSANIYDVINKNLGDLSVELSMFDSTAINDGGGGTGELNIKKGLSETTDYPLTANIVVTVIDPSAGAGADPILTTLSGSIVR